MIPEVLHSLPSFMCTTTKRLHTNYCSNQKTFFRTYFPHLADEFWSSFWYANLLTGIKMTNLCNKPSQSSLCKLCNSDGQKTILSVEDLVCVPRNIVNDAHLNEIDANRSPIPDKNFLQFVSP